MNRHLIAACGLAIFLIGCANPSYRYDIRGNGEGGADIKTVDQPYPNPPPQAAAPQPSPTPAQVDQQQQIDQLKTQVQNLSAENQKLKQSLTTRPTINP
jgi:hypothetical protein